SNYFWKLGPDGRRGAEGGEAGGRVGVPSPHISAVLATALLSQWASAIWDHHPEVGPSFLAALGLLRVLFRGVGFSSMDFLSAITPQIAVLGLGALVLLVVRLVLTSIALRE